MISNASAYLEGPKDILLILIDRCPEIPPDPILAASVDTAPDIQLNDDLLDRLIVLKKAELACLSQKAETPDDGAVYRLYPERCAFEVDQP